MGTVLIKIQLKILWFLSYCANQVVFLHIFTQVRGRLPIVAGMKKQKRMNMQNRQSQMYKKER